MSDEGESPYEAALRRDPAHASTLPDSPDDLPDPRKTQADASRNTIERKASEMAAGDVVVLEDGSTTTILNISWNAASKRPWVNFDNSLGMSFGPDDRFYVLPPAALETGVDDLPDPPDHVAFEAARRQYLKEQFISGRDELSEPQGSLGRDAERRWHLRDLPPDMLPLPEDLTGLLATYPELEDMLREAEAEDNQELEPKPPGPDIEPDL